MLFPRRRIVKKIVLVLLTVFCLAGGSSLAAKDDKPAGGKGGVTIGLSFGDLRSSYLFQYEADLRRLAREAGATTVTMDAKNDARLQNTQVDKLLDLGVNVIIICAEDGRQAVSAVEAAVARGVPVIAFDRFIPSSKLAVYLSMDQYEIGRIQARGILSARDNGRFFLLGGSPADPSATRFRLGQMEILQPLIDSGRITVVGDEWAVNWDPENAHRIMSRFLEKTDNGLDAVVASNDGTALGALQALQAHGLAGKVPISGQDATVEGCNSIVKGDLTLTVFKDFRRFAPEAIDIALRLARREPVEGLVSQPLEKLTLDKSLVGEVPCRFVDLVAVDRSNMYDVVVTSGFHDYDDVYRDVPEKDRPPRP
jgi:D-xylose transport system substrate-binding protein